MCLGNIWVTEFPLTIHYVYDEFLCCLFPDTDDLAFILQCLQPTASQWKTLGLQLGLSPGKLDEIAVTPLLIPGGPIAYLQEVLTRWLNDAPSPTLNKLCGALRSPTVEQNRIAHELEKTYLTQKVGLSTHK